MSCTLDIAFKRYHEYFTVIKRCLNGTASIKIRFQAFYISSRLKSSSDKSIKYQSYRISVLKNNVSNLIQQGNTNRKSPSTRELLDRR